MTKIKPCAECGEEFEYKTHNQKYCSNQCCRISTNKRIMEKYYQKKERLSGKEMLCAICNYKLSKYSESYICAMCDIQETKSITIKRIGDIKDVIAGLEKGKGKKSSRN